jgi:hypothetical protein
MKKVMQTRFADGGNCLQACLASILEIPLERAPDPSNSGHPWVDVLSRWLNRRGWGVVHFDAQAPGRNLCLDLGDAFVIACGKTTRSKTRRHAVLYHKGRLAHDPLPGGHGLKGPPEEFLILFPLNPARTWTHRPRSAAQKSFRP